MAGAVHRLQRTALFPDQISGSSAGPKERIGETAFFSFIYKFAGKGKRISDNNTV